ncbi:MAG: Rrf2 family transcriptional regulator [Bacteroidetes bacterium HLUCCA01]|nr:MAG: Rrf2 family transcriptional regulator [Bacteroidetes bacterium HLUCCA01]
MQLLSTGSQYVLTALILIGRRPEGETISATELAAMLNSPTAYLSQMLAKLQEPGIIGSRRGANGGVYIAKPLKNIRLIDIIITLEGDAFFRRCFLGIDGCGHIEPCPFHDQWTSHRSEIGKWLSSTTLYDLCNDVNDNWITERLRFNRAEVP